MTKMCALAFALLYQVSVLMSAIDAASEISLRGSLSTFHPPLTKSLQVRCAVRGFSTPSQTTSLYTSITTSPPDGTVDPKPQSGAQVTSTGEDVSKLLSVVITKVNQETGLSETLASVTGCSIPVIEGKFISSFQAEGSSEGSNQPGEAGFLVLTWDRPDNSAAGIYSCEAYALNSDKHPVSLTESLEITSVQPNISDLLTYISANERELSLLKTRINEVAAENAELRQVNDQLSNKTSKLEDRVTALKGPNVQNGTFSCYSNREVTFTQPYNEVPTVFISTASVSIYTSSYSSSISASYSMSLQSVTRHSFNVYCSESTFSTSYNWLAIGN